MTSRNYYAEAIDILTRPHNAEDLLISVAKLAPSVLVKAHAATTPDPNALIDSILHQSRCKIDAIKALRGETNLGLKESKDEVERRMSELRFEFP